MCDMTSLCLTNPLVCFPAQRDMAPHHVVMGLGRLEIAVIELDLVRPVLVHARDRSRIELAALPSRHHAVPRCKGAWPLPGPFRVPCATPPGVRASSRIRSKSSPFPLRPTDCNGVPLPPQRFKLSRVSARNLAKPPRLRPPKVASCCLRSRPAPSGLIT